MDRGRGRGRGEGTGAGRGTSRRGPGPHPDRQPPTTTTRRTDADPSSSTPWYMSRKPIKRQPLPKKRTKPPPPVLSVHEQRMKKYSQLMSKDAQGSQTAELQDESSATSRIRKDRQAVVQTPDPTAALPNIPLRQLLAPRQLMEDEVTRRLENELLDKDSGLLDEAAGWAEDDNDDVQALEMNLAIRQAEVGLVRQFVMPTESETRREMPPELRRLRTLRTIASSPVWQQQVLPRQLPFEWDLPGPSHAQDFGPYELQTTLAAATATIAPEATLPPAAISPDRNLQLQALRERLPVRTPEAPSPQTHIGFTVDQSIQTQIDRLSDLRDQQMSAETEIFTAVRVERSTEAAPLLTLPVEAVPDFLIINREPPSPAWDDPAFEEAMGIAPPDLHALPAYILPERVPRILLVEPLIDQTDDLEENFSLYSSD